MPRPAARLRAHRSLGLFGCVALVLSPSTAGAFNYPEHERISRLALSHVLADQAALPVKLALDMMVAELVGKATDPPMTRVSTVRPEKTFSPADIPALAADHSPNPQVLHDRWLTGPAINWGCVHRFGCKIGNAVRGIEGLDSPDADPALPWDYDNAGRAVDRAGFLGVVRSYDLDRGVIGVDTTGIDGEIADVDCLYTAFATRGRTHFRLPGIEGRLAVEQTLPNAASWYFAYHVAAEQIATRGAQLPHAPENMRWLAAAFFFELFGMHYLEDSVAAGHTVSPGYGFGDATISATHDSYNASGVSVTFSDDVCDMEKVHPQGRFPKIHTLCGGAARPILATVRGDHALAARIVATDPKDVTEEMAVLLAYRSITEVVARWVLPGIDVAPRAVEACAGSTDPFGCLLPLDPTKDQSMKVASTTAREGDGTSSILEMMPRPADVTPAVQVPSGVSMDAVTFFRGRHALLSPDGGGGVRVGGGVEIPTPQGVGRRLALGVDALYGMGAATTNVKNSSSQSVGGRVWFQLAYSSSKDAWIFWELTPAVVEVSYLRRDAVPNTWNTSIGTVYSPITVELFRADRSSIMIGVESGVVKSAGDSAVDLFGALTLKAVFRPALKPYRKMLTAPW